MGGRGGERRSGAALGPMHRASVLCGHTLASLALLALLLGLCPASAARHLLNALAEHPRHHYTETLGVAYFKARSGRERPVRLA
jgi:hypothetical protein